jgi:hypothetical protein
VKAAFGTIGASPRFFLRQRPAGWAVPPGPVFTLVVASRPGLVSWSPSLLTSLQLTAGFARSRRRPSRQRGRGDAHADPHVRQVPRGHHGVGWQPVYLGLALEEEERAVAADPVVRVAAVQPGVGNPGLVQLVQPRVRAFAQLVERAELDRVGGAGLGAGLLGADAEPVVAQGVADPWIDAWPRSARIPPPGRPILSSSSWSTAAALMYWTPTVCWVQPTAWANAVV